MVGYEEEQCKVGNIEGETDEPDGLSVNQAIGEVLPEFCKTL